MKTKLTPKRERFCQEMMKRDATQYQAYKTAFHPKRMKRAAIDVEASKLMRNPNIVQRLNELREPITTKIRMTHEQWLDEMETYLKGDVRKLVVGPGQPVDIHDLADPEAYMLEGHELVENFTKVGDKAEHTGYTHKVKYKSKGARLLEYGKARGFVVDKKELGLDATLEEIVKAAMADEGIEQPVKKKK